MLPRFDGFLAGIRLFVRRRRPQAVPLDEATLAAALEHARQLAAGKELDEPAALFFACALRSRAFGAASHALLPVLARNQAQIGGLRLDLDDVELAILHARIALGAIAFEELRDTFSAAQRTVGQGSGRPPPRRPA
jgi:hypothetical protein